MATAILSLLLTNCSKNEPVNNTENQIKKGASNKIAMYEGNTSLGEYCIYNFDESKAILEPNLRVLHDKYSLIGHDNILSWVERDELDHTKINELWHTIIYNLSIDLNISTTEVETKFEALCINDQNWTTIYNDNFNSIPIQYKNLIEDIENKLMANVDLSDQEIETILDQLNLTWSNQLDPKIVSNVIEVAKSSFLYWRVHLEDIYSDGSDSRRKDPKGLAQCLTGDGFGALWGSFGGPGGALLGAVGGTLGTVIQLCIF